MLDCLRNKKCRNFRLCSGCAQVDKSNKKIAKVCRCCGYWCWLHKRHNFLSELNFNIPAFLSNKKLNLSFSLMFHLSISSIFRVQDYNSFWLIFFNSQLFFLRSSFNVNLPPIILDNEDWVRYFNKITNTIFNGFELQNLANQRKVGNSYHYKKLFAWNLSPEQRQLNQLTSDIWKLRRKWENNERKVFRSL